MTNGPGFTIVICISYNFKLKFMDTSGQDGGVGRYTLPPCTNKRRTTTNLKTKINPNYQKIVLYGSLTAKELKKKHSSRLIGGVETDSLDGEDSQQVSGWQPGGPTYMQIDRGNKWGVRQTSQPRVPAQGNKASKPLTEKKCGG